MAQFSAHMRDLGVVPRQFGVEVLTDSSGCFTENQMTKD